MEIRQDLGLIVELPAGRDRDLVNKNGQSSSWIYSENILNARGHVTSEPRIAKEQSTKKTLASETPGSDPICALRHVSVQILDCAPASVQLVTGSWMQSVLHCQQGLVFKLFFSSVPDHTSFIKERSEGTKPPHSFDHLKVEVHQDW